jgi:ATP-binding cassette subfamily C (CFTR/MRP) protein 1
LFTDISIFFTDLIPLIAFWFASKVLHNLLLDSVLHAPLSFTDTTPLGRILSRFSRDIDVLDNALPKEIADSIFCFFDVSVHNIQD